MARRSSQPEKKSGNGGFTLMEILVAVTILAMAYLVLLQNFSLSFRNLEKLERVWRRDFTALLARELDFRTIPTKAEVELPVGEVLVTGLKFQVVLVGSREAPGQSTLLIRRRP
jgi:prepilin-type N-terminal cleavage/methylation domain-containing protein